MTDGVATVAPSAPPSRFASVRAMLVAHPTPTAVAVYALVAVAAAVAAYLAIFTQFAPYDDEGTLLVTIKAFVHGDPLYRDVYTPYGPFYYELFGGLFALTGWQVSTDASRIIVIVVWIATSGLYGLAVHRLTGRLALGVTGMIVAFTVLGVLVNEPMHPHGLAVLLLGGFTLLVIAGSAVRKVALSGVVGGALLGALLLTKVNLGGFALAAVALAAVLSVESLYRRRWLRLAVVLVFLAMPTAVMSRDLTLAWVRDLIALEFFAAVAIVVAAWSARPEGGEDDARLSRWLVAVAAGLALALAVVLGTLLLTGPTPSDVYGGVIDQALRIRDAFVIPFVLPPAAADWGIAAVAGAVLASWLRLRSTRAPAIWPGLLRIGAGLTIWFSVAKAAPFGLNPAANQDALPLALAWVAALPPSGAQEPPYRRFLRVLLPALAVAEAVQVYPVAGSQVGIAAIAFVPVGAMCLADGLRSLQAWSAARGTEALRRLGVITTVVTVALAGKFAFESIARPAAANVVAYANQRPLALPGASLLRIPVAQAEAYERLVGLLHQHRCTTFVGYPSFDSLYLWSSIEAPKPQLPGPWMLLLDAREQQRVVDQVSVSAHPCAIRNDSAAGNWLQGAAPPSTPLVRYIVNDFRPVEKVGELQFLLPKRTR